MTSFELQKAKKKIRQAIDGKYEQKSVATVAAAVGTRHVAIDGNLASASLPDGSSGAVEVVNAGRLASARYELRAGGTVSVVSGGGGGSGGGSGISFSEADTRYYTKGQLDTGQLDIRYYTESELDAGALDTRYFTESESDGRFVRLATAGTITAQHSFSPGSAAAPFLLGANAQGQTVVGLKADQLNKSVIAGAGLLNGGALTGDVTINVGAGTLIAVNSNDVALANGTAQYQVPVTGATPFTPAYTALSAFAGNGLTFGSSFAVGVANTGAAGLSVEADAVRLTSSSAPGAAASILASDATGKLTLPLFVATSSVTTPSLITASGDLSVTPAGSNIAIANSKTIQSNYVSGWAGSGYRIDSNVSVASQSFAEFDNLSVRGTLSVYELVINQIRATNGTLIVSSAGKIDSVSGGNWTFEDPNGSNLCPFAVDDLVIIQEVDVNASTLVKRIVRRVSVVTGKTITTVAATGGPADTGAAAAGDTVVRIGNVTNVARRGSVLITSDMSNSPYTDTISGVTSWADWTGGTKTRVRMGHLSGITGTANEYGLIAGDGFTTADSWVKFSTVAVIQNNVDSGWYNSGTKIVVINTAKGIDINAFGTGYDAVRSYSFSDGTTYRGGLQAYLNAGETQVKMHSLGPGVASIATVLAENTATNATAQVSIAATNSQTSRTASISLIASSAAHEVDVSADLIALSANKIHITNGTAADGSASAPILSFLNDADTGIYRAGANQLNFTTGGVERMAITASSVSAFWDTDTTHTFGRVKIGYVGHGDYAAFAHYDQANSTSFALLHQSDGRLHLNGASGTDIYFKIGNSAVMRMNATGLNVGDGSAPSYTLDVRGRAGIRQLSTTAAVPTLILTQSDVSEEFIDFSSTIGAGNAIDTAALGSYYGKVRVSVNGTFKWLALYD